MEDGDYICVMREREREREGERSIQLCDMAGGNITDAFDSWVIHRVAVNFNSVIYGRSAAWVSSCVPQRRRLCIPLLEY